MITIQKSIELEKWNAKYDPWGYETNTSDLIRKNMLLSEISGRHYKNVLDIGCGHGFLTRDLPGDKIIGIDISESAIAHAREHSKNRCIFLKGDILDLDNVIGDEIFDLIVITGVIYPQYVGNAKTVITKNIDKHLKYQGILASVHISAWYCHRFPYRIISEIVYPYREFVHLLEIYAK